MEKMNQVSVSEFFAKSKEEMYDMAVEMVEKYNRLVDICNDSAERMAELIERHAVYTNALNNDIADKAAKIELLEKEIEGRKEGYIALKELMDTKYISIDEHNMINKSLDEKVGIYEKEIERLNRYSKNLETANHNLVTKVTLLEPEIDNLKKELDAREKEIMELNIKIRHQRENLDGVNKTLEIRNKENDSLVKVRNNLEKEIEAHEKENARLTERITSMHNTITELSHDIDNYKSWNASLHKDIKELKEKVRGSNETWFNIANSNSRAVRELNNEKEKLEKQVKYLEKELNETCTCKELDLKGHQRREVSLVNALADKNDEIKDLKGTIEYYKNQERIRTDQLRATERNVDELWGLVNELKKEKKEGDDYAREGFKLYVKNTLAEAEGDKNEANEIITEAVRSAYTEWSKTQKKEETKKELNDKFGIPCGEDAIE